MREPTREEVAAAIEHRRNVAGQCGHHAYVDQRHAEVLAEIDRLRAHEHKCKEPRADLLAVECVCLTVGEEVARLHDRGSLVNLAAWALRGIALHDGEQP